MDDFKLFNSLSNPVAVCSLDGEILFVNGAWKSYGSSRGGEDNSYVGSNYFTKCIGTSTSSILQDQLKQLADGKRESFSLEYPCHGPLEDDWFEAYCTLEEYDCEEFIIIEHVNISEKQVLENEISRLQSFLTSHTKYMNHEVRNKISIISGHIELTRDKIASRFPEVVDDHVLPILNAVDEVTVLMSNHDPTSPIFASPNIRETDFNSTIAQAVSRVAEDNLQFKVNVSGEFLADGVQLKHLIDNLVINAMDSSIDGEAEIVIDNIEDASVNGFYVEDSGYGFPMSGDISDFDESDFKTGLEIVKRIAENHGWSVSFMNTERGGRVEIVGLETLAEVQEE